MNVIPIAEILGPGTEGLCSAKRTEGPPEPAELSIGVSRRWRGAGSESVSNIEAEMWSLGISAAARMGIRCQRWIRAGSNAELPGSDGWLEGREEFHDDRALDDLDEGFLRDWLAERDDQKRRPGCGCGGVEDFHRPTSDTTG